jgi:hypothetical protein
MDILIGLSGVHTLPLGIASEQSVHYIWYYCYFISATYFSPGRGCPGVLTFGKKIRFGVKEKLGTPLAPLWGVFRYVSSCAREKPHADAHSTIATE